MSRSDPRTLRIHRTVRLPDPLRVARCLRAPELGPRILFFSGGSALRKISRSLKRYTHNSVHLITPFDSGGSSAELRRAFGMLSVGDLRNRIMALADESALGNPAIYELFSHRLPTDVPRTALGERLAAMVDGSDGLVAAVPTPMRRLVRTHLRLFAERMPADFDLRGASIGNLILAGGYLNQDRDMDSVVYLFSKLVGALGTVLPVVDASLHLKAHLADGREIVEQHRFTGKAFDPIEVPILRLSLVDTALPHAAASIEAHDKVVDLIRGADLIVFPVGSFYSSVVANLLPRGVGRAIAEVDCPKVYLPNAGVDPEQVGMNLGDAVDAIVAAVRADAGEDTPLERILDAVLMDTEGAQYPPGWETERAVDRGVAVADLPLVVRRRTRLDANRVAEALVSLA